MEEKDGGVFSGVSGRDGLGAAIPTVVDVSAEWDGYGAYLRQDIRLLKSTSFSSFGRLVYSSGFA